MISRILSWFRKEKLTSRSVPFNWDGEGWIVFSFVSDQILVSRFTFEPPTPNWVIPHAPGRYYFEGSSEKDISLIPLKDD